MKKILSAILAAGALCVPAIANATTTVAWTDWQTSSSTNGFTATGTITIGGTVIDVTYNNPLGVSFFYDGEGAETDFWQNNRSGRDPATSAFTSTGPKGNENIPTDTDIIAMRFSGQSTLTFSQPVQDLYFAYVSTNGNRYDFDQDFTILSNTGDNYDGNGNDDGGYWGSGDVSKNIVGGAEYQLVTVNGEPHGVIIFEGLFDTLVWNSLINENWNGFTVGLSTATNGADPVPVPAAFLLFGSALAGAGALRRKRKE